MTEIIIRLYTNQNSINPAFLKELKAFAEQYGVQLDENPHQREPIKPKSLHQPNLNRNDFIRQTESIGQEIGTIPSDSAVDIRELRDNR